MSQPGSRMRMRPASTFPVMGEARRTTAAGRRGVLTHSLPRKKMDFILRKHFWRCPE